jgi:hypothetical protein
MALLRSRNDATLKHLRQNGDSSEAINFEPRGAADYFPGGPFTRQPSMPALTRQRKIIFEEMRDGPHRIKFN